MILVVTGNKGKYYEIKEVLDAYSIETKQAKMELEENEATLEDTSLSKAKQAFAALRKPLIVDDSGIFFEGHDNWPGHRARRVFYSRRL